MGKNSQSCRSPYEIRTFLMVTQHITQYIVAVLLMRFIEKLGEIEKKALQSLSCRSPYEILVEVVGDEIVIRRGCRSPYEILQSSVTSLTKFVCCRSPYEILPRLSDMLSGFTTALPFSL